MSVEANKLICDMPKPPQILSFGSKRFDVSTLNLVIDTNSRRRAHSLKDASDVVLEALVADANRELANLLQDFSAGQYAAPQGAAKNHPLAALLVRAVRCAAKQYIVQAELGTLALKDDLTGFYNRRSFHALAERQLKLARRSGRGMLLFFIDVDGLKQINDSFGHPEGDQTLRRTAKTLRMTFRESDVIARMGGDEFAVLAVEATGHNEKAITDRLQRYLQTSNALGEKCRVSLSVGVARFDHRNPASISDLMAQADQAMYEQKRAHANLRKVVPETDSRR